MAKRRKKSWLSKNMKKWQKQWQKSIRASYTGKKRPLTKLQKVRRKQRRFLFIIAAIGIAIVWSVRPNEGTPSSETSSTAVVHTNQDFIELIGEYAVAEYPNSKVLPSIVTAQAVLESDFGQSQLASQYFNLFGRKSYQEGEPSVDLPTLEFVSGQYITVDEPFRVYSSWQESVSDHGELLANGTSWNDAHYDRVVNAKDYQEAAYALQEAGYATDPDYAESLIGVIETYELTSYDDQVK